MSIRDRLRRKPTQSASPSTSSTVPASTSQPARFDPTPYTVADTSFGGGHSSPSHCDTSGSNSYSSDSGSPSCDSGSY
ncbi:hypothetical protein ABZY05_49645 [Streptomyces canus]|uniref:hypothetical protein n=1 Tax=Streptomyces canus TaxID=58343 RepID=UPI0033B9C134